MLVQAQAIMDRHSVGRNGGAKNLLTKGECVKLVVVSISEGNS
jgi:hypothetical protein